MDTKIPLNKKRAPTEILFGLIITAILYIVITHTSPGSITDSYNWLYIASFIYGICYSIFVILNYLKILFDKNAGIIISEKHFYKNVSLLSADSIPWNEIENVKVYQTRKSAILLIMLTDNEKYLSGKNFIARYFLRVYIKRWGTPVLIPENFILYDIHILKELMLDKMSKYRSADNGSSRLSIVPNVQVSDTTGDE